MRSSRTESSNIRLPKTAIVKPEAIEIKVGHGDGRSDKTPIDRKLHGARSWPYWTNGALQTLSRRLDRAIHLAHRRRTELHRHVLRFHIRPHLVAE